MTSPSVSVVDQVGAALSVASLRHQVIAGNIANRDAEGYQRLRLQFDRALAAEPGAMAAVDGARGAARVAPDHRAVRPSLEEDMVAMSSNVMSYQALSRSLGRYFAMLAVIANSGRG